MILNINEPKKTSFDIVPLCHTFIWGDSVYVKISGDTAIDISNRETVTFDYGTLVFPCIVEEISVKKV